MKKLTVLMASALIGTMAFAQSNGGSALTNKKGQAILPASGDWAISFSADPVFNYLGNMFNGNTGNGAPGVGWLNNDQTIVGRYYVSDKMAYRAVVRLGFGSQTIKNNVSDDNATSYTFPDTPPVVTDKESVSNMNIGIGAGIQKMKGNGRLQGYYGADAMIWLSSMSQKYTYGNAFNVTKDPTPTSTNFVTMASGPVGQRVISNKSGMTFGIGVRGFIGVEYYILPKISIGAEYGWGIGFQSTGKGTNVQESIGGTTPTVGQVTTNTAGGSRFGADTDLNQGTVFGFHGSNTGTASLRVSFAF